MAKYEKQTLIGKGAIYISQLTYLLYNRLIINSYCYFPPSSLFRCKNHKSLCKLLFYAVCCNSERLTLFAALLLKSKQTKKRRLSGDGRAGANDNPVGAMTQLPEWKNCNYSAKRISLVRVRMDACYSAHTATVAVRINYSGAGASGSKLLFACARLNFLQSGERANSAPELVVVRTKSQKNKGPS